MQYDQLIEGMLNLAVFYAIFLYIKQNIVTLIKSFVFTTNHLRSIHIIKLLLQLNKQVTNQELEAHPVWIL